MSGHSECFECGEEGYIFLEAKTNLISYYQEAIGARLTMPPKGMGVFPEESAKLVDDLIGVV